MIIVLDMFQNVKKQKKQIINQKRIKAGSLPRKQNKNNSQNSKKSPQKISAEGVRYLK